MPSLLLIQRLGIGIVVNLLGCCRNLGPQIIKIDYQKLILLARVIRCHLFDAIFIRIFILRAFKSVFLLALLQL